MAKCLKCQVEVEYPNFKCKKQPGNHTVEAKTYYHTGAKEIQDFKDRRRFAPLVILEPVYDYRDPETDKFVKTDGLSAQFQDGQLTTEDARLQWYLDEKQFPTGDEGLKLWRSIYLTPDQNMKITSAELEDVHKRIKEQNTLLEQMKASKGK